MRRGWILVAASAAAAATCYRPNAATPCSVSCKFGDADSCPDSLQCFSDNLCHAPGVASCVPDAGVGVDSSIDTPSGSQGSACYGTGDLVACFAAAVTGSPTLPAMIDTDAGSGCEVITDLVTGPPSICAIKGAAITVGSGAYHATGSLPLVLIADSTITVEGDLSVASDSMLGLVGAGRDANCITTIGGGGTGAGGGAGGSHGTLGGSGGDGTAATGAKSAGVADSTVIGGCSGGNGGNSSRTGGAGGLGGGVVYLIARNAITVTGRINASGGGGFAGGESAGGGGGGAGGYIGLDAPTITDSGIVIAGGGGGGGGGDETTAASSTGNTSYTCSPATPGGGGGVGGAGGAGSVTSQSHGDRGTDASNTGLSAGGGGGGGGAGVIRMFGGGQTPNTCP